MDRAVHLSGEGMTMTRLLVDTARYTVIHQDDGSIEIAPKDNPKGTQVFHRQAARYEGELIAAYHRNGVAGLSRRPPRDCRPLVVKCGAVLLPCSFCGPTITCVGRCREVPPFSLGSGVWLSTEKSLRPLAGRESPSPAPNDHRLREIKGEKR